MLQTCMGAMGRDYLLQKNVIIMDWSIILDVKLLYFNFSLIWDKSLGFHTG